MRSGAGASARLDPLRAPARPSGSASTSRTSRSGALIDQQHGASRDERPHRVIHFELRLTHHLYELTAQRIVDSSHFLLTAAAWTYWNSEFTVICLTLLWVYLRRHERFARFRNAILLANLIGLIGYALMPTAPPWMFPADGFVGGVNHSSELIHTLGNPYAAMPSLHAADALIVGYCLAVSCRRWWAKALWAIWPLWVWFCVIATANHYVLDVLAGIAVAVFSLLVTAGIPKLIADSRPCYRKPAIVAP